MSFKRKTAVACSVFAGVALPAYANNPPRPDGLLYLILVFPLIAIASHLAGVEMTKGGWPGRIGRGVFFTLVIFLAAAGTEIGVLAMLVIVLFGLVRSLRIGRHGQGKRRILYSALTLLGTLLAGVGYLWALTSTSGQEIRRSRQKRTMADMRAVGTAIMAWSFDNSEDAAGEPALGTDSANDNQTRIETKHPGTDPEPAGQTIVFFDGQGPRLISPAQLGKYLVPNYIKEVPELDGWLQPPEYRFDPDSHRFQIRSGGADHAFDGDRYTSGPFDPVDFNRDIVYADGEFFCWPGTEGESPD